MTLAPVEVPAKMPSSRASRIAMATASSVETLVDVIGNAVPPERHHKTRADAIDLVRARPATGQNRRFLGSTATILIRSLWRRKRLPGSPHGRRGAHALDKAIDPPAGLAQISSAIL